MWSDVLKDIKEHKIRSLARAVSYIENEVPGYEELLIGTEPNPQVPVIGITGPPGAGKSTLTDALVGAYIAEKLRVAVLCVDPSSPFNKGAILGDRIRMSEWYNNSNVYIRSLATRGNLGGLHPKTLEISDLLRSAGFDRVIIETVGVGQSEIDIARLADVTLVVLVPEAGDDIQAMKSGLMEIAEVFVVNKSDRPDSDRFMRNLQAMIPRDNDGVQQIPVIKTNALKKEGIQELADAITERILHHTGHGKMGLLAERAYQLIQQKKMKGIDKEDLLAEIKRRDASDFNLYKFVEEFDS